MATWPENYVPFFGLNNPNFCLSNFYPCKISYMGLQLVRGSEQGYQIAKIRVSYGSLWDRKQREIGESMEDKLLRTYKLSMIKRLGRKFFTKLNERDPTYKGWDALSFYCMIAVQCKKFDTENLRAWLLRTGKRRLLETNPDDNYWGIGKSSSALLDDFSWTGKNMCGKALMMVRAYMRPGCQARMVYDISSSDIEEYWVDDSNPEVVRFVFPLAHVAFKIRAAHAMAHRFVAKITITFSISDIIMMTEGSKDTDAEIMECFTSELSMLSKDTAGTQISIVRTACRSMTFDLGEAELCLLCENWDGYFAKLERTLESKTNFRWEGFFQRVKRARGSPGQKSRTVEPVTRVSIKYGDDLNTSSGSEDLDGVSIDDPIEVARRGTIGSPDRKSCSGGKLFLFLVFSRVVRVNL